jgi:hypothetical protein
MGSLPSKKTTKPKKSIHQLTPPHPGPDDMSYIGTQFSILHKINIPFQGQGNENRGFNCAYIEKRYWVSGRLVLDPKNPKQSHDINKLVSSLRIPRSANCPEVFYLICSVHKQPISRPLPDPPYIRCLGSTKWILEKDLATCLTIQPKNISNCDI